VGLFSITQVSFLRLFGKTILGYVLQCTPQHKSQTGEITCMSLLIRLLVSFVRLLSVFLGLFFCLFVDPFSFVGLFSFIRLFSVLWSLGFICL